MHDLSPIGYVLGLLIVAFGAAMLGPTLFELIEGHDDWPALALASAVTVAIGLLLILAFQHRKTQRFTTQQAVLLTVLLWVVIPFFGTLPFIFSSEPLSLTDAFFESMSGFTTTGSTVLSGLEDRGKGILLWRGLLQWMGGIVVVVVAVGFLPQLGIGGMQLFRSGITQSSGEVFFRVRSVLSSTCIIYVALTALCVFSYASLGMDVFEATVHSMTTIATGGFGTRDTSFAEFGPEIEYSASIFMILASFPFIRYMQLMNGRLRPFAEDSQIRAFLGLIVIIVVSLAVWRVLQTDSGIEESIRHSLFNSVSILTGTGYVSRDYGSWGGFAVTLFFLLGLIGGCAGSTTCSVKIFRYQVLAAAFLSEIRKIESPRRISRPTYQGEVISNEVISSVMGFLFLFAASLAVLTILLSMTGLDFITSASGAATALSNVGPGLGNIIGPTGHFGPLPDSAKWLLIAGMLLGRLEILTVLVLFQLSFWRD